MRPHLTLLALTALLVLGTGGCGASKRTISTSTIAMVTQPQQSSLEANYDSDDTTVLSDYQAAGAADTSAITTLVQRYYAAAAHGNGATACALTVPYIASTIPQDYTQELGPAMPPGAETYLQGAKTCQAVLSLLFEHNHRQLTQPVQVTGVRLAGNYGYALIASTTLPASLIEVGLERGAWQIDSLLGRPLP